MCDQAFHYNVKTKRTFKISAKKLSCCFIRLLVYTIVLIKKYSRGLLSSPSFPFFGQIFWLFVEVFRLPQERPRLSLGSRQLHTVTPLHAILQAAIFF
ncbi:hypothetical protein PGT21_032181 [Puccinia graminis f. sp. tritici]|uniref:Uncharacterized protein n=1 Tax=Puccinia graminis f. sp. tritici TaxID=56615 RepID=A0A5B0LZ26_PUCGR|nr:hypothetical protein PGT21_032181 [Puccinia graminis f. sp. tritici]